VKLGDNVKDPRPIQRYKNLEDMCKEKHNGKYIYDDFIFLNMNTKGIIKCAIHGEFLQDMHHHLQRGQGCPKCKEGYALTKEEAIKRAVDTYGNLYDYSLVDYKNTYTKVKIKCTKHNQIFEQTMEWHWCGVGCPECLSEKRKKTTSEFISQAKVIHNNFYSYDKAIYTGVKKKLIITCPKHGDFEQIPNTHLSGGGCSKCSAERSSYNQLNVIERFSSTPTTFYVIEYKGKIKIGITVQDVLTRYRNDVDNTSDIKILHTQIFNSYEEALNFEAILKEKYVKHRYYGKRIFKNTGNTEVYKINVFDLYLSEL